MKIVLQNEIPSNSSNSTEIANTILSRIGLLPRKSGSTKNMNKVLLELYERSKLSNKMQQPHIALMSVEEMAIHAGITRQTFYEYLVRWIELNFIVKQNYVIVKNNTKKILNGYRLNGSNILNAFEKVKTTINENLNQTLNLTKKLQNEIKREKLITHKHQ